jgi:hypothetical protein
MDPVAAANADGDSVGRRVVRRIVRLTLPVVATLFAAGLGYALAIFPFLYHVVEAKKTETVGGFLTDESLLQATAAAYYDDVVRRFDEISWSVPTVPTPFVGHAPRPGRQHNAYINRAQFRGERELRMPKPDGTYRILMTGASVVYGSGASSDERTIGGYLQSMLDDRAAGIERTYEVFTLATPGWSSTHERIAIENRLSELEPDLVISVSGVADAFYGEHKHNVLWSRAVSDQFYWKLIDFGYRRAGLPALIDVADVGQRSVPPPVVGDRIAKNTRLSSYALALAGARYHFFLQPSLMTTRKPLTERERLLLEGRVGLREDAYYLRCYEEIDARLSAIDLSNYRYTTMEHTLDHLSGSDEIFVDSYHFGDRRRHSWSTVGSWQRLRRSASRDESMIPPIPPTRSTTACVRLS